MTQKLRLMLYSHPCRCYYCRRGPYEERLATSYTDYAPGSRPLTDREYAWLAGYIMASLRSTESCSDDSQASPSTSQAVA